MTDPLVVHLALHSNGNVVNKDLLHKNSAVYWIHNIDGQSADCTFSSAFKLGCGK